MGNKGSSTGNSVDIWSLNQENGRFRYTGSVHAIDNPALDAADDIYQPTIPEHPHENGHAEEKSNDTKVDENGLDKPNGILKNGKVEESKESGSEEQSRGEFENSETAAVTPRSSHAELKLSGSNLMQADWEIRPRRLSSRRFSCGDKPPWFVEHEQNDDPDMEGVDFLLGRAKAYVPPFLEETPHAKDAILFTEVAPSNASIDDLADEEWKFPIDHFSSKKKGNSKKLKAPKRIKSYYKAQDELITSFEDVHLDLDDAMENADDKLRLQRRVNLLAKITLAVNVMLLIAKSVAVALSGSISIISSLLDSAMDLVSGAVIWWTSRAVRKRNPYSYPQGRTRLEPVGIIILAVVMAVASLQIIKESVTKMISLAGGADSLPNMDIATIAIALSTVVVKFILYMVCRKVDSPSIQALALDHRNDVLSNTIALIFGYIGSAELREKSGILQLAHLDPIGAILISLYIIINWGNTAYDQIKMLTGYTASPEFLSKITWICMNHHPKIKQVETVRAFHFGNNFLVEVDVVLPEKLTLKKAHDIGEPLQQKLERLPDVERAFVHLDYEVGHHPHLEHKIV
ncbi:uncharacterized protein LOC135465484 [Liolophura sinensis]|uniref:uncharacterized protein LOC135465484 n=1 Tax=Liolophura sinensis TaxID=3198878 RepID=UPI003157F8DA